MLALTVNSQYDANQVGTATIPNGDNSGHNVDNH